MPSDHEQLLDAAGMADAPSGSTPTTVRLDLHRVWLVQLERRVRKRWAMPDTDPDVQRVARQVRAYCEDHPMWTESELKRARERTSRWDGLFDERGET